jgi:prepilin-type N-terminal cleavage/methylation domain-containing protein
MHYSSKRAFTIIELIIVISIIAILTGAATVNFTQTRAKARDANIRSSLEGYQTSIAQYFLVHNTYLISTGNGTGVGYQAQGWGRMTAKQDGQGGAVNGYGTISIADALQQQGFLAEVHYAPGKVNASDSFFQPADSTNFKDFLLAVCDRNGAQAKLPAGYPNKPGEAYALYGILAAPKASEAQVVLTRCGAPASTDPWLTTVTGY